MKKLFLGIGMFLFSIFGVLFCIFNNSFLVQNGSSYVVNPDETSFIRVFNTTGTIVVSILFIIAVTGIILTILDSIIIIRSSRVIKKP